MNVRVVVKEPGKSPEDRMVADDVGALQDIVGGYIEQVPGVFNQPFMLLCNEEGKLKRLKPNVRGLGDIIVGPVVALKYNGAGETVSLTDQEVERVNEMLTRLAW